MRHTSLPLVPAVLAVAASLAMAACDNSPPESTAGQKLDAAVASVERKAEAAAADAREGAQTAGAQVGQALDTAGQKVGQAMDTAGSKVGEVMDSAGQKAGQAMDAATDKVKDATITTSIKAKLAKDETLSALAIDVDTTGGRVSLQGTAPNAAARDRATRLAMTVEGVVSVDNQLKVAAG